MAELGGLRYCLEDVQGETVGPCRPVDDLLAAIVALKREVYRDGKVGARQDSQETRAAQAVVLELLGLESRHDDT